MKRYWPVAASLVVLLAAVAFLISQGGDSARTNEAAVAATPTPTPLPSPIPYIPPQQPPVRPLPRGTPLDPQTARDMAAFDDGTRLRFLGQLERLLAVLTVIDGDRTYCGNLCPLPVSNEEAVDDLNEKCRQEFSFLRFNYANYPDAVALIDVLSDACRELEAASLRLGKPVQTQAWRDARSVIVKRIRPVVSAGNAQPRIAPTPTNPVSPLGFDFYPAGTFTGIPGVDRFLRTLYAGDVKQMADDAVFPRIACIAPVQGPGGPWCPEGVAAGTEIEAIPLGNCSPQFAFTRDQLRERLGAPEALRLYAVYGNVRYGSYSVAVVAKSGAGPFGYYIDDAGRVTGMGACGGPVGASPDATLVFPTRGR
jgi:hypothetical protein